MIFDYSSPSLRCETIWQVIIYDAKTQKARRTYARFKDKAYCGSFRPDGKVVLAGGEDGILQVATCFLGCLRRVFGS